MKKAFLFLFINTALFAQKDNGDLIFTIERSAKYPIWSQVYKNSYVLEYRNLINSTIALPHDVEALFCECNQENAFYDPKERKITICYEFLNEGLKRLNLRFQGQLNEKIGGLTVGVLGHEFGHLLADIYSLPITGKEENASDQFSVVWPISKSKFFQLPMFYSAVNWYFWSKELGYKFGMALDKKRTFADIHAPNQERYYDIISVLVGSNVEWANRMNLIENGSELLTNYKLPLSRANRSRSDYTKAVNAWNKLLETKLKGKSRFERDTTYNGYADVK